MKKVYQDIMTVPGGNCLQACVASILELPLEKVPHFVDIKPYDKWFERLGDWLRPKGYGAVYSQIDSLTCTLTGLCILGVRTQKHIDTNTQEDWMHAIVGLSVAMETGLDFEAVHDPLPNPTEILEVRDITWIVRSIE